MMDPLEKISPFLYYTYLPFYQPEQAQKLIPGVNFEQDIPDNSITRMDESEMIEHGIQLLKSATLTILKKNGLDFHIVPLSGGLDSRGILASLVNAGLRDRIIAVTFGSPGSWDYELGSGLARKFNIQHRGLNLEHVEVSTENLLETARAGCSWTFLFDGFFNSLIPKEYGNDAVYWSGFMGDTIAGGNRFRMPVQENKNWEDLRRLFVKRRGVRRETIDMSSPEYNPVQSLPKNPIVNNRNISYTDQLYFFIHNMNYLARVILINGFNYQTLYRSPAWVKFMLSLSRQDRMKRTMYKKILIRAYPEFYSYPIQSLRGASLKSSEIDKFFRRILHRTSKSVAASNPFWHRIGIFKNLNYVDFDRAFRERSDYKKVILENISDLKARKYIDWFDPEKIWKDHIDKKADLGIALVLLTALEISLKSDESSI